jgi:hypothetical protein
MFEFKAAEIATFVDAFDGLSTGMYLVDAEGRLIHANAAGSARAGIVRHAAAALFVRRAALMTASASQVIDADRTARFAGYRRGGGVPEVAAAFGVAETTVRTHVSHLFEKNRRPAPG